MKIFLWLLAFTLCVAGAPFRVVSFNVGGDFSADEGIGPPGQVDHDSVRDILIRLDADVVCLQEIFPNDFAGATSDLDRLATAAGYPHVYIPGQGIDRSLRVVFLSRHPFLLTEDIAAPAGANDLTRRHPVVMVDLPDIENDPILIGVHAKSGFSAPNPFRRAVDLIRIQKYLDASGLTAGDNVIVLGDLNLIDSQGDMSFAQLPPQSSGGPAGAGQLPVSYDLGNDITFPVEYFNDPSDFFSWMEELDIRALDGNDNTQGSGTLDYILLSQALLGNSVVSEIYESALDVSNTEGLVKSGNPLAFGTSFDASDHFAIVAQFDVRDPVVSIPDYDFSGILVEGFDGFAGESAPDGWLTTGGEWMGVATAAERGFYSLEGGAFAVLGAGEATATFLNTSGESIQNLEIQLDAQVWAAMPDGAESSLKFDFLVDGQSSMALDDLEFRSSDVDASLSTAISGLSIPVGASFQLQANFSPGSASELPEDAFVNEFHYDNSGADEGEFIELAVGSGTSEDLTVFLYNGSNGSVYNELPLETFTAGEVSNGFRIYSRQVVGLQNGFDGIALVGGESGVIEFISYEGVVAAVDGPANGMQSLDIGVSQSSNTPVDRGSLTRVGSVWSQNDLLPFSVGALNPGQSFPELIPAQGVSFDNLMIQANRLDQDGDGLSDLDETFLTLTDPTDANSRFEIESVSTSEIAFQSIAGRRYILERSFTLNQNSWEDIDEVSVSQTNEAEVFSIGNDPDQTHAFYRIRIELQ